MSCLFFKWNLPVFSHCHLLKHQLFPKPPWKTLTSPNLLGGMRGSGARGRWRWIRLSLCFQRGFWSISWMSIYLFLMYPPSFCFHKISGQCKSSWATMTAPWPGKRRPLFAHLYEGQENIQEQDGGTFHPCTPDRTVVLTKKIWFQGK